MYCMPMTIINPPTGEAQMVQEQKSAQKAQAMDLKNCLSIILTSGHNATNFQVKTKQNDA
jgi:hypothetical protein